ncbi:SH3 domain-binding protein 4-A-like isoform X1 [Myxocyprinus asiaticus]|uniref:SH3 domain-binding protein 4-A-like isoform X1 n=1 Tax=Myxocyprinus asiaticus TaxID=70543 RepID=UPI002221DB9B|nr:SH3 domain-binding protein 4-A-like isoform X1 [Myxocyprinus asiaticus]XP_051550563.1 SH3 domain-binding protein 4-A-like isoform X1 [Myxocyprinus asiaticus]XP_051550565.1 SH3 domain-binding protein 4-A-like isoform X1 [Myxocyprinus asiaticus]
MAAHRIRVTNNNNVLPRCKSEGTLIDIDEGVTEASLLDVKVPSPSALRLAPLTSFGTAQEVVAIKDYCPSSFTTLKFSKGDHLYVLDTSGGEWWYAHNNKEMGYIPSTYVQPINYRNSSLSDSGMIDNLGDCSEEGAKELEFLGEWNGLFLKPSLPYDNNNPFSMLSSTNPFLNGSMVDILDQNSNEKTNQCNSLDLLFFDSLAPSAPISNNTTSSNSNSKGYSNSVFDGSSTSPDLEALQMLRKDNPFFRSKRSYSLSELSILQAQSNPPLLSSGFFSGLKAPSPEQFQNREDFRTAWLNHRKLARSCHDLESLGQNPGWGQTQPVETNIVCKLDSCGGAVQLPDTNISIHVPEGHVAVGDTQQISMKALLDPPLELNNDRCTTVSPVVEIKLSNMEIKSFITLEIKVSVAIRTDQIAEVLCVRSDFKEGPYSPVPQAYIYGDTIQVQLHNMEPCMYVAVVVQTQHVSFNSTVWDHMVKKVTLGLYGPKHIHPSFKTVVAIFGHDCAPKTLLVSEVGKQAKSAPPVTLQLWGKHQFVLNRPQDLQIGMYSNMSNYEVKANEQARIVRGFQVKLGKVSRLIYMITSRNADEISDFTLRVQVKDDQDFILAQFCVQTPHPPPKTGMRNNGQRRFLKKKEVDKILLSPLAITTKYPQFQERCITNLKFGKLIKTIIRQTKNQYLLEYKKGDIIALLSEEKIKLKGQLWTKEWYIGYYQGKIGLVHVKNVLVLGKVKPIYFCGPDLTTTILIEQILKPCKFLTYIYASVRTILMENLGNWRAFADALGYGNLPLTYFCHAELDSEPERVASVLEKLKEDCLNMETKDKKSFQKELMMALLKMDCQGLVARLIMDFVLLTTAVEVAPRWRELAEKLAHVSRQQMEAYEAPHRDKTGVVDSEAMWKPAYDFLLTWAAQIGDSYRDVIHELHMGLDRMKNPITKRWKHLTGTLILVNCLDMLRSSAFCPAPQDDFAI